MAQSTISVLDTNILFGLDKPTASMVTIDPATAQRWLEKNTVNRVVRARSVDAYAKDMTAGRWHMTGEPIQFDHHGRMINGQHRCHAIIKSGVTIVSLVVRGLDPEAQRVMDSGAKRSVADALHLGGYDRGPLLAASVKLAALYDDGRLFGDTQKQIVTTEETFAWLDSHPEFPGVVHRADSLRHKIDCPPSILTVAYWLTSRVDPAAAEEFFGALAHRTGLPDGSPILAVDSRLRELRRNKVSMQANRRDVLMMLIRAWNAWRQGRTLRTIPLVTRNGKGARGVTAAPS